MNDKKNKILKILSQNKINNDFMYNYVIINNIKHTKNINGIFINLNSIDDNIIDNMYEYIKTMSYNINEERNIKHLVVPKTIKKNNISYKSLPILDKVQNKILEMSKTI